MRKVLLPIVGVLLLGAGVAIGWFAARFDWPSGKPVILYRAADPDLLAPPPSWQEWKYPNSRIHTSGTGADSTLGRIEFGSADRVALVTEDDFDKVWAYYRDRCKLDAPPSMRFGWGGSGRTLALQVFDDVQAHSLEGPKTDPPGARAFAVKSLRYTLVGFVYRPVPAGPTCILLVYRPNKEFLSLLKEKVVKE